MKMMLPTEQALSMASGGRRDGPGRRGRGRRQLLRILTPL